MTRHYGSIGCAAVLLATLGVAFAQDGEAPAKSKESGKSPFTGKALFVQMKQGHSPGSVPLEEPQVKTLGERTFLIGRVVNGTRRFWLPLADVARIEEFADVEELGKHYQIGRPAEKKGP